MRSVQRLNKLEQQVHARLDREIAALLPDLSHWTEAELDAAIQAIEDAPHTPQERAALDRLNALTPAELLAEHYATLGDQARRQKARRG